MLGLTLTSPQLVRVTEGGVDVTSVGLHKLAVKAAETPQDAAATPQRNTPSPTNTPPPTSAQQPAASNSKESEGSTWTHSAVLLLIDLFRTRRHHLSDPSCTKRRLFAEMARELKSKGYSFTADACMKKTENLKTRYKIIKDKNARTGRGRSSWVYFDLMDDTLRADPAIIPPVTVSSLGGVTVATDSNTARAPTSPPPSGTPPPTETPPPAVESPPAGTPGPSVTPSTKKRRDKRSDLQMMLIEGQKRQETQLERLTAAIEARNELLQSFLEKL
ncbi:hypothetical protein BaRGS_00006142 [Batillaria attramentaria]|uniref:Myb/SANT-like DNA-binding domain-containing protein n=1 Tax=Batillaria attramentaria TaxID=370345 RepID=A0ABD0LTF1_9CAEN